MSTPTTPGAGSPGPVAIADPAERVSFDPENDYWADVALVEYDTAGNPQVVRGEITDTDLAKVRRFWGWKALPGVRYGILANPDLARRDVVLVAPGEQPLDLRVAFEVDLAETFLSMANITVAEYRRRLRRHDREIAAAAKLGYDVLAVDYPRTITFAKTAR